MKIAYVIDKNSSALGIAAAMRQEVVPEIDVIEGLSYLTPRSLSNALIKSNYDLIIFSWRFFAFEFLSLRHIKKSIDIISSNSIIAIIIPDHLGASHLMQFREDILIRHVDYFLVTNEKLFQYYAARYPAKCKGVLHDLPNIKKIEFLRSQGIEKSRRAIWVGNSNWGKRAGIIDHKGHDLLISPLLHLGAEIRVIDSALERLSNLEVLTEIAKSTFLLQTSRSEGTGLPLLEAAGLGVIPITTNVGVAEEFLRGLLSQLISNPTPKDFLFVKDWALRNEAKLSQELIARFDDYVSAAQRESIYYDSEKSVNSISVNLWTEFKSCLLWFLRSGKYRVRHLLRI